MTVKPPSTAATIKVFNHRPVGGRFLAGVGKNRAGQKTGTGYFCFRCNFQLPRVEIVRASHNSLCSSTGTRISAGRRSTCGATQRDKRWALKIFNWYIALSAGKRHRAVAACSRRKRFPLSANPRMMRGIASTAVETLATRQRLKSLRNYWHIQSDSRV